MRIPPTPAVPTFARYRSCGRYLLRHPGRDVDLDPEGTGVVRVVSASGAKHKLRCDTTKVMGKRGLVGIGGWLVRLGFFSCCDCDLVGLVWFGLFGLFGLF